MGKPRAGLCRMEVEGREGRATETIEREHERSKERFATRGRYKYSPIATAQEKKRCNGA